MGEILSALTLDPPSGPWTADDYFALPEASTKVELQDGCYVVSPYAGMAHQMVAAQVARAINDHGHIAFNECDVRLSDTLVRRPDVLVLRSKRPPAKKYPDPEDLALVVEIVSPTSGRTDRLLKPAEYAEAGIPGFWLVELDPALTLTAFALAGTQYRELGTWGPGELARITEPVTVEIEINQLRPR